MTVEELKLEALPSGNLESLTLDGSYVTPRNKKGGKKLTLFERIFKKNKLKKPNSVAVIFLRNNGVAQPMELETKNGFFNIEGKTYHENTDCIYTIKDKERTPLAIIPEWSLLPLGTKAWEDHSMQEKFAELQDHTLRGIRHAELVKMGDKGDVKLNAKSLIGLGILAIIVIAVGVNYI